MLAGDFFTPTDRKAIERAVRNAESGSGLDFSVYVGSVDGDSRSYAEGLHTRLSEPTRAVLIVVDPVARQLEIVTGTQARRFLDDAEVGLAALGMQTAFAGGDFVGGIANGVQQLGDHARRPPMRHAD